MLIASIVGLDIRSTMDLDTTLRGLPLTEEKVLEAVGNIIRIDLEDEVTFETVSINTIRKDDNYGGFYVKDQRNFRYDVNTSFNWCIYR